MRQRYLWPATKPPPQHERSDMAENTSTLDRLRGLGLELPEPEDTIFGHTPTLVHGGFAHLAAQKIVDHKSQNPGDSVRFGSTIPTTADSPCRPPACRCAGSQGAALANTVGLLGPNHPEMRRL
jgi:hypothetical protein